MSKFSGYKNVAFRVTSVHDVTGLPNYRGRTICYDDGRRLWQETSKVLRLSRGDALRDARMMANDHVLRNAATT